MKNKTFSIKNLSSVVIIGDPYVFDNITSINNKYKLNTFGIFFKKKNSHKFKENFIYEKKISKKFTDFLKKKCDVKKTLFISMSSRILFKSEEIKKLFNNHLINYHPTRLPNDKGGGGFSWRIMKQDRIHNLCFHKINTKLDEGDIIFQNEILFPKDCIIPQDFINFNIKSFYTFYDTFIKKLKNKHNFDLTNVSANQGSYYPRLDSSKDSYLDWSLEKNDLINFINAFGAPYSGATTFVNKKKKLKVFLQDVQLHGNENFNHPGMVGIVIRKNKKWLIVSIKNGYLIISSVKDKKGSDVKEKISVGDRFFTPINFILKSYSKRTKYK